MSTSHFFISSDSDDESTSSFVSYIILSNSKAKDVTSPTVVINYVPDLDTDTEPFEAPASPDYTLGSDTETSPFEEDPQEANPKKSSNEDPLEEDELLLAQAAPTPPTQPPPSVPTSIIITTTITIIIIIITIITTTITISITITTTYYDTTMQEMHDHIEELPLERFMTMKHEIHRAYTSVEVAQEEIEILQAELGAT
nr:hypothetical protein [Tanacetum cinerariifolium]